MRKKIIVYPSSSNPPTWGHADIMQRAACKFDLVYWVAAYNPSKQLSFSIDQRMAMMMDYVEYYKLNNVIVEAFSGAVARFALSKGAPYLLRGLRNTSDFHQELELSAGNRGINKELETICLFAKPHFATISSSLVRELALLGEQVDQYVLPSVADKMFRYLEENKN